MRRGIYFFKRRLEVLYSWQTKIQLDTSGQGSWQVIKRILRIRLKLCLCFYWDEFIEFFHGQKLPLTKYCKSYITYIIHYFRKSITNSWQRICWTCKKSNLLCKIMNGFSSIYGISQPSKWFRSAFGASEKSFCKSTMS